MLDRVPPPPLNSTSSLTVLNLTVESTSSFIGAVTMGAGATVASNLGVTGAVTITGVLTAQSSLAVSSATTLTGPVSLGGALSAVSGLSSLAGLNASATAVVSLTVSSAVTFSGLTKVLDQGDFIIQNQADTTKQLEFNLSGQTTGKLLTISSLLTTSQTLQIPNITATDTLATLGLAQAFTAVNTFSNSQDATALGTGALVLSAGGLSVNNQIRLGGALTGSGTITGTQLVSTIATGTAPFTVTSTTVVPNLNVSQLLGQTWANPGAIGGTTPATTFALSGILTSTNTTSATTSLLGAVVIGNGTAATSVAFGAGNAQVGAALTVAGVATFTNATAANAGATTGGAVYSGGVVAVGAFQSQLGFGVGLLPTAANPIAISSASNALIQGILVQNANTGTATRAGLTASNATHVASLNMNGTSFTTSGINVQDGGVCFSDGVGGMVLAAANASGAITFAAGGTTTRGTISSAGVWTLGPTSNPAANTFAPPIIYGRNNAAVDNAGAVGETIVGAFSGVAAAATTVTGNVGSVSLTAGKWLVSGKVVIHGGATGLTSGSTIQVSLPVATAGTGTSGTTMAQQSVFSLLANDLFTITIDPQVINISATTSEFLTCNITYAAGSPTFDGSITAVRVP